MEIRDIRIDQGKAFDWGRTSADYARYRDIYPEIFYQKIRERGIGIKGQKVLDLGTGTGVLPPEQIHEARRLAGEAGMKIDFFASAAEDLDFPPASFDAVTACQCFWYFDHKKVMPLIRRFLKKDGRLLILYMAWLPFEDPIAGKSEELVLKYNPCWSGAGERIHPIEIPEEYFPRFCLEDHEEMELMIGGLPFPGGSGKVGQGAQGISIEGGSGGIPCPPLHGPCPSQEKIIETEKYRKQEMPQSAF